MSTDDMYWAVNGSQSKVQRGQQHFGIQCLDNNSWFPNPAGYCSCGTPGYVRRWRHRV